MVRWLAGRALALSPGRGQAAELSIPAEEWRLIAGRVKPERYLPMHARRGIHRLLNPAAVPMRANLVKDKAAFARWAGAAELTAPLTVARGAGGSVGRLFDAGKIMLKPSFSSKGKGVMRFHRAGADWTAGDGETLNSAELAALIGRVVARGGVAQEALATHSSLAPISPEALPTARVMTLRIGGAEPVSGLLLLRLGGGSAPVDNFTRGGLVANPEPDGRLSHAFAKSPAGIVRLASHPTTGEPFARELAPSLLTGAIDLALDAHARLPAGYGVIGWDIGLSDRGPMLIEGNWNPGSMLPQLGTGFGLSELPLGELYMAALRALPASSWRAAKVAQIDW